MFISAVPIPIPVCIQRKTYISFNWNGKLEIKKKVYYTLIFSMWVRNIPTICINRKEKNKNENK